MKLFLVRHGETDWNKLGRFQGQNGASLNELGLAQARDTARAAISWRPTALYSSPLCRTMQVAGLISGLTGVAVVPDPRLQELDLGELDGVSGEEMRACWPEFYQTWRDSPELVELPGGESLLQLQERTWQALQSIEEAHRQDDAIVIVSHNFAIRALCGRLLGLPLTHFHRMYLSLGSVSTVERSALGWRLLTYNSTCHLSPENRTAR